MKITKKNIAIFIVYAIVQICILGFAIKYFSNISYYTSNEISLLNDLVVFIRYGIILFAAVLVTSYFDSETKTRRYAWGIIGESFIYLLLCCIILAMCGTLYFELTLRLAEYIIIYLMVPAFIAHFYGKMCAAVKNNIVSVILVILGLYVFCFNGLWDLFTFPALAGIPELATPVFRYGELFNRITTDVSYIYSVNPYNPFYISVTGVLINIFWILLIISIRCIQKKQKTALALIAVDLIIFIVSLQPRNDSFVIVPDLDCASDPILKDSWNNEIIYYQEKRAAEPMDVQDFSVTNYDIELWTGNRLKAKVVVQLGDTGKEAYIFTLHHDYRIHSVKDSFGAELEYEVSGDYVTVYNPNQKLDAIVFEYQGYGLLYRGSLGYTYLPEYYKYYPVPGVLEVFDVDEANYVKNSLEYETNFRIKVHAGYDIYCNLETTGKNEFAGKSTGITLLGGILVGETNVDNAKIVYPKLQYSQEEIETAYKTLLQEFAQNNNSIEGKDWIVSNYEASTYENHYNGTNYFTGSYDEVEWFMSGKYDNMIKEMSYD